MACVMYIRILAAPQNADRKIALFAGSTDNLPAPRNIVFCEERNRASYKEVRMDIDGTDALMADIIIPVERSQNEMLFVKRGHCGLRSSTEKCTQGLSSTRSA